MEWTDEGGMRAGVRGEEREVVRLVVRACVCVVEGVSSHYVIH